MLSTSGGVQAVSTQPSYTDAGIAATFAKEPFLTLLRGADVDGGTGRRLHRGHLNALCGGDPSQRKRPERVEYMASPASRDGEKRPVQVEPFSRSAAGKEIAEPGQTRSPAALSKGMHFLAEHFIRTPHTPLAFTDPNTVWGYLWDRFRGIRTTWIPQLPAPTSLDTLERLCASPLTAYVDGANDERIPAHVLADETQQLAQWLEYTIAALSMAAAYMCRTPEGCIDFAVHNKKNFMESMSQCFTFLAVRYRAETHTRHAEFISLLLILYGFQQGEKSEDRAAFCRFFSATDMETGEELWYAESAAQSVNMARVYAELEKQPALMHTPPVRRVLGLLQCWAQRRWFDFFRICREEEAFLTPLQKSFLFQSFTYARYRAVLDLVLPDYSVYAKTRVRGALQVRALAGMLMMEEAHCIRFLRIMGLDASLVQATRREMEARMEVQALDVHDSEDGDGAEWWLRLCDEHAQTIALSAHLKAQCEDHKTKLFFPTYPEYFGFRVWHEAYDLFGPHAGFPTRAAEGAAAVEDEIDADEDGGDDEEGDTCTAEGSADDEERDDADASSGEDGAYDDEENFYQDEYFNADEEEEEEERHSIRKKKKHAQVGGPRKEPTPTARTVSSPTVRSDAVLLRADGCPVNLGELLEPYCPPYTTAMAQLTFDDVPEVFFRDIPVHRRERLWAHVVHATFERRTAASLSLEEAALQQQGSAHGRYGGAVLSTSASSPEIWALLNTHKDDLLDRLDARLPRSSGYTASGLGAHEASDDDDKDDDVSVVSNMTEREQEEAAFGPYVASLRRRDGATADQDVCAADVAAGAEGNEDGGDGDAASAVSPLLEEVDALIRSITSSQHYWMFALSREESTARTELCREEEVVRAQIHPPARPQQGQQQQHVSADTAAGASRSEKAPSSASASSPEFPASPSVALRALPATGRTVVAPLPDDYVPHSPAGIGAPMPYSVESPKTPASVPVFPGATTANGAAGSHPMHNTDARQVRGARDENVEDVPLITQDPKTAAADHPMPATLPTIAFNTALPSSPFPSSAVRAAVPTTTGGAHKRSRAEAEATDDVSEEMKASGAAASQPSSTPEAQWPAKRAHVERPTSPTTPATLPSSVATSSNASVLAEEAGSGEEARSDTIEFSHRKMTRTETTHVAASAAKLGSALEPSDWSPRTSAAARLLRERGPREETSSWQRLRSPALRRERSVAAPSSLASSTSSFLSGTLAPLVHQYLTEAAHCLWVDARRVVAVQDALATVVLNADMSERTARVWYEKLYGNEADHNRNNEKGRSDSSRQCGWSAPLDQLRARHRLARALCVGFSAALVPEYEWVAAELDRLYPVASASSAALLCTPIASLLHALATSKDPLPSSSVEALNTFALRTDEARITRHQSHNAHLPAVTVASLPSPLSGTQPVVVDRYEAFTRLIREHGYAAWTDPATGAATIWSLPSTQGQRRDEIIPSMDVRRLHVTATFFLVSAAASEVVDVVEEEEKERRRLCAEPSARAEEAAHDVLRRLYTNPVESCVAALLARMPSASSARYDDATSQEDAVYTFEARHCAHNSRTVRWCTPVKEEIDALCDQYMEGHHSASTATAGSDNAHVSLRFGPHDALVADDQDGRHTRCENADRSTGAKKEVRDRSRAASVRTTASLSSPLIAQLGVIDSRHRVQKGFRGQSSSLELSACLRVYGCTHEWLDRVQIRRDGRVRWTSADTDDERETKEEEELLSYESSAAETLSTGAPELSVIVCLDYDEMKKRGLTALRQLAERAGQRCRGSDLASVSGQVLSGVLVLLTCAADDVDVAVEAVQAHFWSAYGVVDDHRDNAATSPFDGACPPPLLCVQPVPTGAAPSSSADGVVAGHTSVPVPWLQDALYQGVNSLLHAYSERLRITVDAVRTAPRQGPARRAAGQTPHPKVSRSTTSSSFPSSSSFSSRAFATLV